MSELIGTTTQITKRRRRNKIDGYDTVRLDAWLFEGQLYVVLRIVYLLPYVGTHVWYDFSPNLYEEDEYEFR